MYIYLFSFETLKLEIFFWVFISVHLKSNRFIYIGLFGAKDNVNCKNVLNVWIRIITSDTQHLMVTLESSGRISSFCWTTSLHDTPSLVPLHSPYSLLKKGSKVGHRTTPSKGLDGQQSEKSQGICWQMLWWFNNVVMPGWCGSVDWALAWEPRCCQFDSQSGHMPGLQAGSPGWVQRGNWSMFLSLSFSLPLSLKIKY